MPKSVREDTLSFSVTPRYYMSAEALSIDSWSSEARRQPEVLSVLEPIHEAISYGDAHQRPLPSRPFLLVSCTVPTDLSTHRIEDRVTAAASRGQIRLSPESTQHARTHWERRAASARKSRSSVHRPRPYALTRGGAKRPAGSSRPTGRGAPHERRRRTLRSPRDGGRERGRLRQSPSSGCARCRRMAASTAISQRPGTAERSTLSGVDCECRGSRADHSRFCERSASRRSTRASAWVALESAGVIPLASSNVDLASSKRPSAASAIP